MRTILLFCFLICCSTVNAQHENDNWYFGYHAGFSFVNSSPTVLYNSEMEAWEGCSSISDSVGNLLFYTDGITVYNDLHNPMPNGYGLYAGPSSSQAALVAKVPGSNDKYYIFTTAHQGEAEGLCYSVVQMSLDNGHGDVIQKNVPLINPVDEKVCAISTATGFWLFTRQ
jgi:hypothetical protein